MQERYTGKPHGWIYWKNTFVDMDVHCKCGIVTHISGEFVYSLECPACHTKYMCNGHIELIEFEELPEGKSYSHHTNYDEEYMIEQNVIENVSKF